MAVSAYLVFRAAFPEFSDMTQYPDTMLDYWNPIAQEFVDSAKWGGMYAHGVNLVLAHNIVIAAQNVAGNAGRSSGRISSKGAGDVSVGYDTGSTAEADGGNWNLTTYGQQYLRLARRFGVARQI